MHFPKLVLVRARGMAGCGLLAALIWAAICGMGAASAMAQGNPVAGKQCGDYVEAYKGGAPGYGPYLDQTAEIAKARDTLEGGRRYSKSLQVSSAPSNALWLNNWFNKNPLRPFSEATNRLLEELTGQTPAAATPAPASVGQTQPTQIIVVAPPAPPAAPPSPPEPSACRVGDVGQCRGCSVSCGNGSQATCKPGEAIWDGRCAYLAECGCNSNSGAQQLSTGVSSCRVGGVGSCSGCSVSCNNGQMPICKPAGTYSDGSCSKSECSCR